MQARNLILTAAGTSAVFGLLLGLTTTTAIVPPLDPPWKHARAQAAPGDGGSWQLADSVPQDSSPFWDEDHTPTWKRHPAMVAAGPVAPGYAGDDLGAQPAVAAAALPEAEASDAATPADGAAADAASAPDEARGGVAIGTRQETAAAPEAGSSGAADASTY